MFASGRSPLLLVFFDDGRRPQMGAIGILTGFTERTALPQEIPVPIELDADRFEPCVPVIVQTWTIPERVFFFYQPSDRFKNAFVGFLFCHGACRPLTREPAARQSRVRRGTRPATRSAVRSR